MKRSNKQKGFTIIELVVVILLLGILTATALPRFLNVNNEAHASVVAGVRGGLQTSVQLARASWIAKGQPATITDYGTLMVNTNGYPVSDNSTGVVDNADCKLVFDSLLQAGAPVVAAAAGAGPAAFLDSDISTAGASTANNFVAKLASANTCHYAYIGQFKKIGAGTIPVLVYDAAAGTVTPGTSL
jgi:MSHA pilin protein MshB